MRLMQGRQRAQPLQIGDYVIPFWAGELIRVFSVIMLLANRGAITMEVPFMRSYALALVKACHKRGAPAMGGMSALIPIKNDPVANEKALAGIRHDYAAWFGDDHEAATRARRVSLASIARSSAGARRVRLLLSR